MNIFDAVGTSKSATVDTNTKYTADGIPVVTDTPEQAKSRTLEKRIEGMQKQIGDLDVSQNFHGEFGDLYKYTKYGVTPNLIDKDLDWLRAKNQSAFAQFWNGIVVQGAIGEVAGQTIAGFGAIPDKLASYFTKDAYENGETYSNQLSELGDKITNWTREVAPIYEEHPDGGIHNDSGYIASRMPSLLSSLSLMMPALAYTKGATVLAKTIGKAGKAVIGAERVSAAAQTIAKATRNMGKMGRAMDSAYRSTLLKDWAKAGFSAMGMRIGENYREARETVDVLSNMYYDKYYDMSADEFEKYKLENVENMGEESLDMDKMEYANTIAARGADRAFAINYGNFVFDLMQLRGLSNMWKARPSMTANATIGTANKVEAAAAGSNLTGAARRDLLKMTRGQKVKKFLGDYAGMGKWGVTGAFKAEWTEGIEEIVNEIGQREGQLYGKYLAGDLDATNEYEGSIINRLKDYAIDPKTWDAALWGALGGVAFSYLGNGAAALYNGKNAKLNQRARLAEINGREQYWKNVKSNFDHVNNGVNPFEIEADADGKPILDASGNRQLKKILTDEEKNNVRNKIIDNAVSELTLDAIESGNYELLNDYLADPKLKKALVGMGLSDEAGYDALSKQVKETADKTFKQFINYGSLFANTTVSDMFMNVAIRNNIRADKIEAELQERINKNTIDNDTIASVGGTIQGLRNLGDIDTTMKTVYANRLEASLIQERDKAVANHAHQSTIDDYNKQIEAVRTLKTKYETGLGEELGLISQLQYFNETKSGVPLEVQARYDKWKADNGREVDMANPLAKYATTKGVNEFVNNVSKKYVTNLADNFYSEFENERNNQGRITDAKTLREREAKMKRDVEEAAKREHEKAVNNVHTEFRKVASRQAVLDYMLSDDPSVAPPVAGLADTRNILKTKYGNQYKAKIQDAFDTAKRTHPDPKPADPNSTGVPPKPAGNSGNQNGATDPSSTGGQAVGNAKVDALSKLIDELEVSKTLDPAEQALIDALHKRVARINSLVAANMSQDRINSEYAELEKEYKAVFKNFNAGSSSDQTGATNDEDPTAGNLDSTGLRNSRYRNTDETWEQANNRIIGKLNDSLRELLDIKTNETANLDDLRKKEVDSFIDAIKNSITKISATPVGDATDANYSSANNTINNAVNAIRSIKDHITQSKANNNRGNTTEVAKVKRQLDTLRKGLLRKNVADELNADPAMRAEADVIIASVNNALNAINAGADPLSSGAYLAINKVRDFLKDIDDAIAKRAAAKSRPPVEEGRNGNGRGEIVNPNAALDALKELGNVDQVNDDKVLTAMSVDDFIGATITVKKPFTFKGDKYTSIDIMDDGFGSATVNAISNVKVTELSISAIQHLYDSGAIDVEFDKADDDDALFSDVGEVRKYVSNRNKAIKNAIYNYLNAVSAKEDSLGRKHLYFEDLIRFIYDNMGTQVVTDLYADLFTMCRNIMDFEDTLVLADTDAVLKLNMDEMLDRIMNDKPVTQQTAGNIKGDMIQVSMEREDANQILIGEHEIKRYKVVMGLGAGDEVTIRKHNGEILVESDGILLGTLPKTIIDSNGNFIKTNENFKYLISVSNDGISYTNEFIDYLKDLVFGKSDLLNLIEEYKIYKERRDKKSVDALIPKIFTNKDFNELKRFMLDTTDADALGHSIDHLAKILSYYDNSAINNEDSAQAIAVSLDSWVNKLGNSYNDIAVLFNTVTDAKRKVKLGLVSSGRILKHTDNEGNPLYTNIKEVVRAEDSDDYELYVVGKEGFVLHAPTGIDNNVPNAGGKGTTLMFIRDSSGNRIRVHTRNNTITHRYNKGTKESNNLADAVLAPIKDAANALLTRKYELIDEYLNGIRQYFSGVGSNGSGIFYGWNIVSTAGGWVINNRDGKSKIWFNYKDKHANRPNISITSDTGTSFLEPVKEDLSNPLNRSINIFDTEMEKVAYNVIFNTLLGAFDLNTNARDLDSNGKMWLNDSLHVVYELPNGTIVDTGKSYKDFMIDNNMLVTDVDAVRDADGNILGNFIETSVFGEGGQGVQSVNNDKNMHILPKTLASIPIEEKAPDDNTPAQPALTGENLNSAVRDAIKRGTTFTELLDMSGAKRETFYDFIELFDKLGVTIDTKIGRNNYASYKPAGRVMTIGNKFFTADSGMRIRTLLHELTHAYLHDGTNIEVLDGVTDIYNQFIKHLDDPNVSWDDATKEWLNNFRYKGKGRGVAIEEFLVEAMTNKSLMPILNDLAYMGGVDNTEHKSLLSKLLELVKDLFVNGFDINKGSLLDAIDKVIAKAGEEVKVDETIHSPKEHVDENLPKEGRDKYKQNDDEEFVFSTIGEYNKNSFGSIAELRASMPVGTTEMFDEMVTENKLSFICRL